MVRKLIDIQFCLYQGYKALTNVLNCCDTWINVRLEHFDAYLIHLDYSMEEIAVYPPQNVFSSQIPPCLYHKYYTLTQNIETVNFMVSPIVFIVDLDYSMGEIIVSEPRLVFSFQIPPYLCHKIAKLLKQRTI